MPLDPKDVEYPRVPTPKELELSRQLVDLQQEKDQRELKLLAQIGDLEAQIQKLQVRAHELTQMLQSTKRDQVEAQQIAVKKERAVWKNKVRKLQTELDQEKNDKEAQRCWAAQFTLSGSAPTNPSPSPTSKAPRPSSPLKTARHISAMGLDPTDDVFARFAQSIALLPASQAPRVVRSGVLPFLVHLLQVSSAPTLTNGSGCDVVAGSVLLALVHLAIHKRPTRPRLRATTTQALVCSDSTPLSPSIAEEIVKAGVTEPLVGVLRESLNPRVLSEAARLCAALGIHIPNKRVLAAKSAVRFIIQRLTPALPTASLHREEASKSSECVGDCAAQATEDIADAYQRLPLPNDSEVQKNMLSALVNLCNDSEILRSQIVNCVHFVPVLVRYVRESPSQSVQTEAAKLLSNLAANHVVNQSAIMTAEGDAALSLRAGSPANVEANAELVRASSIGLANLAYTSVNQLSIGYGDATTFLLQALVDSASPPVIEAAATAIACLCHSNPLNKSRVAAQNGLQVLLFVISESHRFGRDDAALTAACECLAVVARTPANRAQVLELDGHLVLCQLCSSTPATSPLLLEAFASVVCALIPTQRERRSAMADGRENKLESKTVGALLALERAAHLLQTASSTRAGAPQWLTDGIQTLRMYQQGGAGDAAEAEPAEAEREFHERGYFVMESVTSTAPDALCPNFYADEVPGGRG